jgi:cell division protein FtsB
MAATTNPAPAPSRGGTPPSPPPRGPIPPPPAAQGAPGPAPEAESEDDRQGRTFFGFVANRALPLLTAALTALTAFFGVTSVTATQEKGDLEDTVASLRRQNDTLAEANATLDDEVVTLTDDRDRWRERAQDATSSADDTTEADTSAARGTTPTTTPAPDDGGGAVRRSEGSVELTAARSLDLDSQASDWAVYQGFSGDGDIYLEGGGEFSLTTNGRSQLVVMSEVPDHAACESSTALVTALTEDQTAAGTQVCVHTGEGRLAHLNIVSMDTEAGIITLDITVWE